LFCQQDRAILCKDCDSSIHAANEHTKKHDRFLLTGVKLSATSSVYKPTSKSSSSSSSNQDFSVPGSSISNPPPLKKPLSAPPQSNKIQPFSKINGGDASVNQWGSTSTISEYLMDTLPGWHVEDFLDSSLPTYGFSKVCSYLFNQERSKFSWFQDLTMTLSRLNFFFLCLRNIISF